jgi:hypothetical protein
MHARRVVSWLVVLSLLVAGGLTAWLSPEPDGRPTATSRAMEAEACEKLAFQSLENRLPRGKGYPLRPSATGQKGTWERLNVYESNVNTDRVSDSVRQLHERTRDFFVQSPGAGFRRIVPTEYYIENAMRLMESDRSPAAQPGSPAFFVPSEKYVAAVAPDEQHYAQHDLGRGYFLRAEDLGYVKDRRRVSGFRAHGFHFISHYESDYWHWRIHHVLLVGLLMHERPVVYDTGDRLPSMEQVRELKTRPLDEFEQAGLEALKGGEDVYVIRKYGTLRMLGALRAASRCLQCHDGTRGDLLGALSYTLRPAPRD